MNYIEKLLNKKVQVISNEGKIFLGELISYDSSINIILNNTIERIFSEKNNVIEQKMGLFMLRGDNVAIISEIDQDLEKKIDYSKIKGNKLKEFISNH
jgi:U6 snRNA-associated Sm-like protein LSm8